MHLVDGAAAAKLGAVTASIGALVALFLGAPIADGALVGAACTGAYMLYTQIRLSLR